MEPEWAYLVAEVVGEFTRTNEGVKLAFERLRQKTEYGEIHNQWVIGRDKEAAKKQVRALLVSMGYTPKDSNQ